MAEQDLQGSLAVGQTMVSAAPGTLSTVGSRSCFVLVLYDPRARVGGMAHLQLPAAPYLAHFVKVTTQRLLAEMHGKGALRGRVIAHVILGPTASENSLLRTISGTVRAQGIAQVERQPLAVAGHEIRFGLGDGHLAIENTLQAHQRSEDELVTELGTRLLALHSIRRDIGCSQPEQLLDQLLQQIADAASELLNASQCILALEGEGGLRIRAASGQRIRSGGAPAQAWSRLGRWVQAQGKPVLLDGTAAQLRIPSALGQGLSLIGAPLGDAEESSGVIYAMRPDCSPFDNQSLHILDVFCAQARLAISNSEVHGQLARKASEMESIIQSVGEGLVVVDPSLRLVMANPVAREMLDLADLKPGQRFPTLSPLNELFARARQETHAVEEIQLDAEDGGSQRIVQASLSNVTDHDGKMQGIVAALRDVTEQKELERLRSELLSTVSHELRTPLHSIRGFVDLILMGKTGKVSELQRDFLTTVRQQSAQLHHILDDLLEFSRQEYGQVEITMERVELAQLVKGVCRKLALLAADAGVRLMNVVPSGLAPIEGDSVRLEQVLSNLVDNAVKFTPRGGRITIGAESSGDAVTFWVADTGIGIPREEQANIFSKFYQISQSSRSAGPRKGAGLGLTICKNIVEQHHGDIWVESDTGKGSTFYVTLPKANMADELELDPEEMSVIEKVVESPSPLPLPAMPTPIISTGKTLRLL